MGAIFDAARTMVQDDLLSKRDVGMLVSKALEDGVLRPQERADLKKVTDELTDKLSDAARKAIDSFLALGDRFDGNLAGRIFGIDQVHADRLERGGVTSVAQLFAQSRTPEGRQQLSAQAEIDIDMVTDFAERADLARTVGVGKTFAAVLDKVGVNNVQQLANQDPRELRDAVREFIDGPDNTYEGNPVASRTPSLKTVRKWVDSAEVLPWTLRYAGDSGPNFTKAAFDALDNRQKAGLLYFCDNVETGSNSVFECAGLTQESPRRKPAVIKDLIAKFKQEGFYGPGERVFEEIDICNVSRIKAHDEVIGWTLDFDVVDRDGLDYEGNGYGAAVGVVNVSVDAEGNVLEVWDDVEYDGSYEG